MRAEIFTGEKDICKFWNLVENAESSDKNWGVDRHIDENMISQTLKTGLSYVIVR